MKKKKTTKVTLLLFFGVIAINYLTATGKIPGISSQKDISSQYTTPITPAGFAFSIWGVIYFLLFLGIIYLHKTAADPERAKQINAITPPLWAMFAFNVLWNISFGLGWIEVSFFMIFGYWASLVVIERRLLQGKGKSNFILPLAFGIHCGWITIATIVNLYAVLVKRRIAIPENIGAIAVILGVLILIFVMQGKLRNAVLPLATAWAFFGIYVKSAKPFFQFPFISILLWMGIVLLVALAAYTFKENNKALLPRKP
ncbi:hypothetical protein ABB02_00251 [Clostridiaceae bacterium JG1575]|nr:hypothetical protein ABB02_00251 [Clostridiaceae bacterium JG1575]